MASATVSREVVNVIAGEMAMAVERAVDCWMLEIEQVFGNPRLTTLGRLNAVREILDRYRSLTGKSELMHRSHERAGWAKEAV